MENTWENNYKLAVLRAAGVDTLERLANIDLAGVRVESSGNGGGGCETCGDYSYISVTVYWKEGPHQHGRSWDGEEEVVELIRSFGEM